jgi:transcriptional regulator with XRE-family HTH domain
MATGHSMGDRLKALRLERYERDTKWTQEHVAKSVGTTKANISKLESKGKPGRIDLVVFFKLADLYDIDPRELATGKRVNAPVVDKRGLSLLRALDSLHPDIKLNLEMLVHTLNTSGDPSYHAWGKEQSDKARKRDAVHEEQ